MHISKFPFELVEILQFQIGFLNHIHMNGVQEEFTWIQ